MPIAAIRITTEPAELTIRRTPPLVEMERSAPEVRVQRRAPQVRLERDEYQGAVGVLLPQALASRLAGDARAAALEATGQISAEGDTLMRIEEPGNTIAALAAQKLARDPVELELRMVPPARFRVADPGGISMRGEPGRLHMSARTAPPEIEFKPARVAVDTEVPPRVNVTA
jgi:hypothetical protein